MVDQHLETTSTTLQPWTSVESRTHRWAPETDAQWGPPSPRQPSGKDPWNQWTTYNLTLLQLEQTTGLSGQKGTGPPTEPGFSPIFFSPFCHRLSFGSLPLSPLACLVGDTSFPAISSNSLLRYYLNWTELEDAITKFNNEMPSAEKLSVKSCHFTLLTHYFPILILCSCFVTICIVKSTI